jgi:hypothetical protein
MMATTIARTVLGVQRDELVLGASTFLSRARAQYFVLFTTQGILLPWLARHFHLNVEPLDDHKFHIC